MQDTAFQQLSTSTTLLLLFGFYGLTFLMSLAIGRRNENVDGYMVSNGALGFGISAASMIATWIWAASFYAAPPRATPTASRARSTTACGAR